MPCATVCALENSLNFSAADLVESVAAAWIVPLTVAMAFAADSEIAVNLLACSVLNLALVAESVNIDSNVAVSPKSKGWPVVKADILVAMVCAML